MINFLIAASDSSIRNSIKISALSAGFHVTEVTDGMTAVNLCNHEEFDVIIMDTGLPKLDGFSVCKEIRKQKTTPLIFISSSASESDKIHGFEVGGDDFMVKPLSVKVLMARVNAIIQRQTGRKIIV